MDRQAKREYFTERCVVCGKDNHDGFQAMVQADGEAAWIEVAVPRRFQGFDDIVHGGLVTALLDESMWYALYEKGHTTLTVDIHVTFRRPTVPHMDVVAEAKMTGQQRRYLLAEATLTSRDGHLLATATGRFLHAPRLSRHLQDMLYCRDV